MLRFLLVSLGAGGLLVRRNILRSRDLTYIFNVTALLESTTIADWRYKAEGAINLVFQYVGQDPRLYATCIRVKKTVEAGDERQGPGPNIMFPEVEAFVKDHIRPIIGAKFLCDNRAVPVNEEFLVMLKRLTELSSEDRPQGRHVCGVDTSYRVVTIMPDYTHVPVKLPRSMATAEATETLALSTDYGIEIKPKSGVIPAASIVSDPIKAEICRFCMMQETKLSNGHVQRRSSYCPQLLFSTSARHLPRAISALVETPQNNLRVFRGGNLVFSEALLNSEEYKDCEPGQALSLCLEEDGGAPCNGSFGGNSNLSATGKANGSGSPFSVGGILRLLSGSNFVIAPTMALPPALNDSTEGFQRVVAAVLQETPLLQRLLQLQGKDRHDVENLWSLVRKELLARYDEIDDSDLALDDFISTFLREKADTLRGTQVGRDMEDFLVAHTAKDCSIILSIRLVLLPTTADSEGSTAKPRTSTDHVFGERSIHGVIPVQRIIPDMPQVLTKALGCADDLAERFLERMCYQYTVAVVDLDPKRADAIPYYARQDRSIVAKYRKAIQGASDGAGRSSCLLD